MWRKTKTLVLLAIFALLWVLLAMCFAGCSRMESALYRRQVAMVSPAALATNTVWQTNLVVSISAGGTPQTNVTTQPVQIVTTLPALYQTNLVPRQEVSDAITAGGSIPVPGAGVAGLALGWLYTAWAAYRNRKTSVALVTGIEAGRRILNETPEGKALDAKVRAALETHQAAAGVLPAVGKLIESYTGKTTQ